jgi:hypothetical protein
MMRDKLEVIQDLMEELINEMEYGKDDFDMRLGKKKPMEGEIKIAKIEGIAPGEEMEADMTMEEEDEEDEESMMDAKIQRLMASR